MKILSLLSLSMLFLPPMAAAHKTGSGIAGKWEGESVCTVPNSPCTTEHVVYEISRDSSTQNTSANKWTMDAYKIVDGEKQFMGALQCTFDGKKNNLSCLTKTRTEVDWEYFIDGDNLRGTLVIGAEKTLYRKVTAKRIAAS